ncbi:MAG: histidine kinase [Saprospiraceae bacterium]|nr:histidine kinase [Saprospiraceae bacterium]NNL90727.1 histidine kinase [Saprospiraceae bacterium]
MSFYIKITAQDHINLTFKSELGIVSYLTKNNNVNRTSDVGFRLNFQDNTPEDLYLVGNEKLYSLFSESEGVLIENISQNVAIFENNNSSIFKISNITSPSIDLKMVFVSGNWQQPITFINQDQFDRYKYNQNRKQYRQPFFRDMTRSFFLIMTLFGLLSFVMFRISKIKVYLFYSLHALMISIYYLNKVDYISVVINRLLGSDAAHLLNNSIQPIMYYFLTLFVYEFLDSKNEDRKFAKLLLYFARYCLYACVAIFVTFFFSQALSENIYNLYRLSIIIYSFCIGGYLIIKRSTISTTIIGYSNIVLILFGTMAMITSIKGQIIYGIAPLDWFTLGMLIFIIGITTALGFKANKGEIERIRARETVIKLERENNQRLESDLQMTKLREKNSQIEKDISELELLVLRNQLNPHFLYNSMNTLKLYILNNENIDAAKFIDRFSGLFRKVLNNSRQRLIKLEDEIEAMKQYLDLERIRFRDKFDYSIEIDDSLDTTFIRIPPMIFQPFLENAINHGLHHSAVQGKILLKIEPRGEDYYKVIIEDNGVGRAYAQKLKSKKLRSYKSLGTQIINDRLTAINKLYGYESFFEYTDLYDDFGQPAGTRVEMILPSEL